MITINDLQPADILLSTGNAKVSVVIRVGTISRYSHASLYIGDGKIIEVTGTGIASISLQDAMSDDTLVSVYRRLQMSSAQAADVIQYAITKRNDKNKNNKYDYTGAFGAGVTTVPGIVVGMFLSPIVVIGGIGADLYNRYNPEASFYCSELVAIAFEKAGVPLGSGAASSTPSDISKSHVLNYVGDLKKT